MLREEVRHLKRINADLLEAVRRLIADLEPDYMPGSKPDSILAGYAAIAKATGQEAR